jgi:hypothetical protein
MDLSICLLLYGDHQDLALRCLGSLTLSGVSAIQDRVKDIRVGMNKVCDGTRAYVELWASRVSDSCRFPVITFERLDVFRPTKYPMMRRMFYYPSRSLGDCVMWFDDDSYVVPRDHNPQDWWGEILSTMEGCDMLGQGWERSLVGKQRFWVYRQPWFNPEVGLPDKLRFCQGAWWCAKSALLAAADYPFKDLQHNGGDSMLGELARHTGWRVEYVPVDYADVRINADRFGTHSEAPRRGIVKELDIGVSCTKASLPHPDHQNFKSRVSVYEAGRLVKEEVIDGGAESKILQPKESHGYEAPSTG